jgi:hypothetical protein
MQLPCDDDHNSPLEGLVKVWNSQSCICDIPYFKLNGIDAINKITKLKKIASI